MGLKKDKTVFVEGRDGWWSKELSKEIEEIFVMGVKLPKCDNFDFYREAMAEPGDTQGKPIALVFKGYIGDITLMYKFKKVTPQKGN